MWRSRPRLRAPMLFANILRVVDWLPFRYLLGIIVVAASKPDQRLGDMAAGTVVIRRAAARSNLRV